MSYSKSIMSEKREIAVHLDANGLNCPLPILKTKMHLNTMQPGDIIEVQATDSHAKIDFEAYCARTGHELLEIQEIGESLVFFIRCAANARAI